MFDSANEELIMKLGDGSIFIDADPCIFLGILNRLRRSALDLDKVPSTISKEEWFLKLDYWNILG